jgi:hypothetical protein
MAEVVHIGITRSQLGFNPSQLTVTMIDSGGDAQPLGSQFLECPPAGFEGS